MPSVAERASGTATMPTMVHDSQSMLVDGGIGFIVSVLTVYNFFNYRGSQA